MRKNTKKNSFVALLLLIMVGATLLSLEQMPTVKADATTDAITAGLDWLDRMAYREINATHAVATDSPMLAFRCYRSDGYYTIFGKETDTNLPSSATMIRGGTTDPEGTTTDLNLITGEISNQRSLFYWDMDGDDEYDDMTLYVEYAVMDDDTNRLAVKVIEYENVGITYDLEIETTVLIGTVSLNAQAAMNVDWGFQGARYTIRPTVKGLADLYYRLGTEHYSWLGGQTYAQSRGVDYLDRALKLYRTWYGSGYILDRFDGHYGVTPQSRPWAGQYDIPNIPRNPDLIKEPWLGAVPDGSSYMMNGASATDNWYDYDTAPEDFGCGMQSGVLRFTTVSRHIMPDEEWDNTPFLCDATHYAFNYRSRTSFSWARNTYIANGLDFDLKNYNTDPIPILGLDIVLGVGTDAKAIRASHDMYKYGVNVPYGLSTLKSEFLDTATWDGNGIAFDAWNGMKIGWEYPAYGTHNTATYGNALIQYYKLTSDSDVGERADEVIGVLLMLQNHYGSPTYSRARQTYYYRPEFVGSFMPGYAVGYSFGQQDIYGSNWVDAIYGSLSYLGIFQEDVYPSAFPVMGNVECTLPSTWALIEYKTTGRTPSNPTEPNYNLPYNEQGVAYTDHGGSSGGDGGAGFIGADATSTYIGGATGNKYQWDGELSRLRMGAWGGTTGDGWSSVTYEWNFTLANDMTNWRAKTYFTTPNYIANFGVSGSNAFDMDVNLYHQGGSLIDTDHRDLFTDLQANSDDIGTSGKMFVYTDLCQQDTLEDGDYTVQLKFTASAELAGFMDIGYESTDSPPYLYYTHFAPIEALPMGLEHFGFDGEEILHSEVWCRETLTVLSASHGHVNMTVGAHAFISGQNVTLEAIPDGGYYFSHWEINGGLGGGQNPITVIMDGDKTIEPIFTDETRYLSVSTPPNCAFSHLGAYPLGAEFDFSCSTYDPNLTFDYITFSDGENPPINITELPVHICMFRDITLDCHFKPSNCHVTMQTIGGDASCSAFIQSPWLAGHDFPIGTQITLHAYTIDPNENYLFDHWTKDGIYDGTVTPRNVTLTNNVTYAGYFVPNTHTLMVFSSNGTLGVVDSTGGEYAHNTQVNITAHPHTGIPVKARFDHWNINGNDQWYGQESVLFSICEDTTAWAHFVMQIDWLVQSGNPVGGYVSSNTANGLIDAETLLTLDATAYEGYEFDHWQINDMTVYSQHLEFYGTDDYTCTAYFSVLPPPYYSLMISVSPTGAGFTNPCSNSFVNGSIVTLYAYPNDATQYHFDHWVIDGTPNYSANPQLLMNQAHTVTAYFERNTYNVIFGYSDPWSYDFGGCLIYVDETQEEYASYYGNGVTLTSGWHSVRYPNSFGWWSAIGIWQDGVGTDGINYREFYVDGSEIIVGMYQ